nr:anti-repressor SinI family protein [Halobacillus sp. Marseille-Q1614]
MKLDAEWVSLLKEAKEIGLSSQEVREFLALTQDTKVKERA